MTRPAAFAGQTGRRRPDVLSERVNGKGRPSASACLSVRT